MLAAALSRLLAAWFVFLLPSYATFKALAHRPLSEPDLHKWSVYWTVIGAFMAVEGHLIDLCPLRLPFYWELKTVFLLFLALPQTEGTTWVYDTYLQPFFCRNEAELDAGIIRIQQNILTFLQEKLTALWNAVAARTYPESHAGSAPAAGSQWSWIPSAEVLRSALNILQPAGSSSSPARPPNPRASSSRSSSNSQNDAAGRQPPPFPVPQHYQ
ncbi:hypothetical protein CVT26_002035 [Gymnopilus dilepis]|uniref:Protein YOP1 n=1 Tax=Gymnopilus dilepis TaxID=231916 RepID=A0A409VBV6_9AGAR|nr:hypothetical protein CVT26_002035 [Gymnopilus dilepis]